MTGWPAREAPRSADDPYAQALEILRRQVLGSRGQLDPAIRHAAYEGGDVPEAFAVYVEKVRGEAYKVTDRDVAALHAAGYSDDQIFELTVAAALGAGVRRLEAGLRALDRKGRASA